MPVLNGDDTAGADVDPFDEAALAQFAGPPNPQGPADLGGGPLEGDPFGGGGGEVQCQVCRTVIDAASGAPVQPVDRGAAEAATRFVAAEGSAADAELGGSALDLGLF
jgi:hypothetical protein